MRTFEEIKTTIKAHKPELAIQFHVGSIALFGSYARGEQDEKSDLDVLVEFEKPVGFLFIHLADYLEDLLNVKVDLVTRDAIKPNRWRYIKEDLTYV